MSCNQNCNQGRTCQCSPQDASNRDVVLSCLFGLVMGAGLALVYIYQTGGF
jgi:hypothetical protein